VGDWACSPSEARQDGIRGTLALHARTRTHIYTHPTPRTHTKPPLLSCLTALPASPACLACHAYPALASKHRGSRAMAYASGASSRGSLDDGSDDNDEEDDGASVSIASTSAARQRFKAVRHKRRSMVMKVIMDAGKRGHLQHADVEVRAGGAGKMGAVYAAVCRCPARL
jgi:hypothetical protein